MIIISHSGNKINRNNHNSSNNIVIIIVIRIKVFVMIAMLMVVSEMEFWGHVQMGCSVRPGAVQLLLHSDVLHHVLPNTLSPEEMSRTFYATFEVALLIDSAPRAWFRKALDCL